MSASSTSEAFGTTTRCSLHTTTLLPHSRRNSSIMSPGARSTTRAHSASQPCSIACSSALSAPIASPLPKDPVSRAASFPGEVVGLHPRFLERLAQGASTAAGGGGLALLGGVLQELVGGVGLGPVLLGDRHAGLLLGCRRRLCPAAGSRSRAAYPSRSAVAGRFRTSAGHRGVWAMLTPRGRQRRRPGVIAAAGTRSGIRDHLGQDRTGS